MTCASPRLREGALEFKEINMSAQNLTLLTDLYELTMMQ